MKACHCVQVHEPQRTPYDLDVLEQLVTHANKYWTSLQNISVNSTKILHCIMMRNIIRHLKGDIECAMTFQDIMQSSGDETFLE